MLFGVGLTVLFAAITYGIQPYGGHPTGWTNPWVLGSITLAVVAWSRCTLSNRAHPYHARHQAVWSKPFALGNLAGLMASVGRGGLQFMLIIWLQGIWLPLHDYSLESTPLWSGIYMLPMTLGFLLAGPLSGTLSDRFGSRPFTIGGLVLMAMTFVALTLIPVDFDYRVFAVLIFLNGVGGGIFTSPNTAAIMSSVPAAERGAALGVRATFTNAGMSLWIGIFFSLMIARAWPSFAARHPQRRAAAARRTRDGGPQRGQPASGRKSVRLSWVTTRSPNCWAPPESCSSPESTRPC